MRYLYFTLLVALLSLNACRFTVPNTGDGQALLESGVFGERVPAWVNQTKQESIRGTDSGIIPSNYSVPSAIKTSRTVAETGVLDTERARREAEESEEKEETLAAVREEEVEAEISPLDRIEQECPGLESAVSDALRTEARGARVRKYESLAVRCPGSSDLWFWLAKDYQEAGQLVQAARSFERVLLVAPENEAAKALLAVVKEKLNRGSTVTP